VKKIRKKKLKPFYCPAFDTAHKRACKSLEGFEKAIKILKEKYGN